jgi:hypothetical protein
MRLLKVSTAILLTGSSLACSYSPSVPLLGQQWARLGRETKSPAQRELTEGELTARYRTKQGERWGVGEAPIEEAQKLPAGSKFVVRIPEGSFAITNALEFRGLRVELIGAGADRSRLILDSEARGFVLQGGSLLVKDLTVSSYASEGLTVLKGDAELDHAVINGARHGIYISRGQLKIKRSIFRGNESGIDLGESVQVEIKDSIFAQNFEAIRGETPKSLVMERCLITASIEAAIPLRMGTECRIESCLIAENREVRWSTVPYDGVRSCLLQEDGFTELGPKTSNRGLLYLEQFPSACPDGIPKAFAVPTLMALRKRLSSLGEERSEAAVLDFAEDEARGCLKRARELLDVKSTRQAQALVEIAQGYLAYEPALKARLGKLLSEIEGALASQIKDSPAPTPPSEAPR